MKRVNIQAAFVGEPTASQQGLEADDDTEAVVLTVRGGELTCVVPSGTQPEALIEQSSVLRGALRLETRRVLSFEIRQGATGAFFEDEPTDRHDRREAEPGVGLFSAPSETGGEQGARVHDIMTGAVVSARPEMSVTEAADLLVFHDISDVPVLDGERLVGMIRDEDLIGRRGATVADLMTRELLAVPETMPVQEVATFLIHHRIRWAPVLREGQVVGMVSRGDVLRWLAAS
jgi:CBS domain-containing protein